MCLIDITKLIIIIQLREIYTIYVIIIIKVQFQVAQCRASCKGSAVCVVISLQSAVKSRPREPLQELALHFAHSLLCQLCVCVCDCVGGGGLGGGEEGAHAVFCIAAACSR